MSRNFLEDSGNAFYNRDFDEICKRHLESSNLLTSEGFGLKRIGVSYENVCVVRLLENVCIPLDTR